MTRTQVEEAARYTFAVKKKEKVILHSYLYSYQNVERIRLIVARGWC